MSKRLKLVYLRAGEVQSLFPTCEVVAVSGNVLPKQWLLEELPGMRPVLRRLTREWPLREVCWEKYVLLRRVP